MGRVCVYDACSVFYAPVNRNLRTWVTQTSVCRLTYRNQINQETGKNRVILKNDLYVTFLQLLTVTDSVG